MIVTGGVYKGRKIKAPDENIARPTLSKVRMGVFNTLHSLMGSFDGKYFLDVFGGSGIMGIEALSRGFLGIEIYEKNPKAAQIIKNNCRTIGIEANIKIGDSLKLLKYNSTDWDVIYVDPPYKSGIYEEVFSLLNVKSSGIIVAEHSEEINIKNFELIKTKNYGGKKVSFYAPLRTLTD